MISEQPTTTLKDKQSLNDIVDALKEVENCYITNMFYLMKTHKLNSTADFQDFFLRFAIAIKNRFYLPNSILPLRRAARSLVSQKDRLCKHLNALKFLVNNSDLNILLPAMELRRGHSNGANCIRNLFETYMHIRDWYSFDFWPISTMYNINYYACFPIFDDSSHVRISVIIVFMIGTLHSKSVEQTMNRIYLKRKSIARICMRRHLQFAYEF